MPGIKKGGEIELNVEKLAFGGKAVARVDDFVVFIEHALPGQRVRVRIGRKKKQYAEAWVTEVLSQSPDYSAPFCPHFGYCGGCQWQDLPYERQLYWKREHVTDCLTRIAGLSEADVEPTVPSPDLVYYRNKMEFTFSDRLWLTPEQIASKEQEIDRSFALGLHVRGFYDRLFNVDDCFLESPESTAILREVRDRCVKSGPAPYSVRTHEGFWRFLVIREGKRTGERLVHLLTADRPECERIVDDLAGHLRRSFPGITTIIHSVSRKKAQVAVGDSGRVLFGPGYIREELGTSSYRISAHSFFQTNPRAAEGLYRAVGDLAELGGSETVWDLYCGTGSISLFLASRAKRVIGFEVVAEAVEDACVNREINGLDNCEFVAGDLKDMIAARANGAEGIPDVVITDPPRSGMHPQVVGSLLELAPARIVYVSCNPSTLARDLTGLRERYEIVTVRPFDLFPHTSHIECVVGLKRKGQGFK